MSRWYDRPSESGVHAPPDSPTEPALACVVPDSANPKTANIATAVIDAVTQVDGWRDATAHIEFCHLAPSLPAVRP